jgi:hypothetical protein
VYTLPYNQSYLGNILSAIKHFALLIVQLQDIIGIAFSNESGLIYFIEKSRSSAARNLLYIR